MQFPQGQFRLRILQILVLMVAVFAFLGAGDQDARFKDLGHRMMCTCGCGQILLECNHVGCTMSDRMRGELMAALDRGDNDDLALQSFVQKYGPTVIAAPSTTGFGRVAWVTPFLALGLGIVLTVYLVRAWKNKPAPALAGGIPTPEGRDMDRFREQARKETDL
jgi:cytochrome c-type biogenesis protein CcmH